MSLRPGIASPAAVPQASSSAPPVGSTLLPFAAVVATKLGISSLGNPGFNAQVDAAEDAIVNSALANGLVSDSNKADFRTHLHQALSDAKATGVFAAPASSGVLTPLKTKILAMLPQQSPVVQTIQPSTTPTIANDLAVVRTLPTGRQFIIPLQFVRTYIPGDMLLGDGDRVEIVSMDSTPAGSSSKGANGMAAVTTWGSASGLAVPANGAAASTVSNVIGAVKNPPPSDVIILRRIAGTGLIDYLLPAQDSQRLSNIYVQPADLVRFDLLELTPQIMASRRFTRAYAALNKRCAVPPGSLLGSIGSWFTGSPGASPSISGSTQGVVSSLQRGTDPITGVSTNDVMTHLQQLPTAVGAGAQSVLR
ncbi:MAG TPA: hypothetical protein VFG04_27735 [Planctomycetaceae bacterium]|nr:hypothetical protein [Planctomycetaceae bacterium]